MDDKNWGDEDHRGYWTPHQRIKYPPVFIWPPRLVAFIKWLPRYLFPWTLIYAVLGALVWLFLTPSIVRMQTFSFDWVALIFIRNAVLTILVVGAWHYWLYLRRSQGNSFKYNRKWPVDDNAVFLFKSQTKENIFWTFASGVPIWTAWESVSLWLYSNGLIASLSISDHPVGFVALLLFVPLLHEFHFYCIHRLLHWPPLYKRIHKIHHHNTNPGPWSGISMHPVEHLIYFSGLLIYWVLPSHPIHMLNLSMMAGLSPAQGHTGFDRIQTGEKVSFHLPYFAHYLHHRYFEVNYADGVIPLDKWFGSFHDGSSEADEVLKNRRVARSGRG